MTRTSLTVNGLRVSVVERSAATSADKPPIVLLHGLIAEAVTFARLVAEMPVDRRIVAIDLPGAGDSERPQDADVSFDGMVEVIREVFVQLGIEKPIVLGHSHGGAVALRLAASCGESLSGLILLCPAHPFSAHEEKLLRFYLSGPGRAFAHTLPHLPRQFHLFAFRRMPGSRRSLGYAELAPYLRTLRMPGTVRHLLRVLGTWKADMRALGEELVRSPLALPVLLLWGERDIVVPASTATALIENLGHATLRTLPGVGHLPNEEAPAECAAHIQSWLRTL